MQKLTIFHNFPSNSIYKPLSLPNLMLQTSKINVEGVFKFKYSTITRSYTPPTVKSDKIFFYLFNYFHCYDNIKIIKEHFAHVNNIMHHIRLVSNANYPFL